LDKVPQHHRYHWLAAAPGILHEQLVGEDLRAQSEGLCMRDDRFPRRCDWCAKTLTLPVENLRVDLSFQPFLFHHVSAEAEMKRLHVDEMPKTQTRRSFCAKTQKKNGLMNVCGADGANIPDFAPPECFGTGCQIKFIPAVSFEAKEQVSMFSSVLNGYK
jgi:hypothetical protein